MKPYDPQSHPEDSEARRTPLAWREVAALVGSFMGALLLAGLVVLLLAHFFL